MVSERNGNERGQDVYKEIKSLLPPIKRESKGKNWKKQNQKEIKGGESVTNPPFIKKKLSLQKIRENRMFYKVLVNNWRDSHWVN